jgi:tRNA threonylcarbamoyladenosine biosynthesis protein TsaB
MTKILHLETATQNCSVALSENGKLRFLKEENAPNIHASAITLFIADVLAEAGIQARELDAVAVSKGPGSYTGLRIGVSTAKGLCYALNKPLIATDTLRCMALAVIASGQVSDADALFCPMIDARRMEVYAAIYNRQMEQLKAVSADIVDEHTYASYFKQPVYFFGDGAEKCMPSFSGYHEAHFIPGVWPSASAMITEAEAKFGAGQFEDVAYFEPYYLKEFFFTK